MAHPGSQLHPELNQRHLSTGRSRFAEGRTASGRQGALSQLTEALARSHLGGTPLFPSTAAAWQPGRTQGHAGRLSFPLPERQNPAAGKLRAAAARAAPWAVLAVSANALRSHVPLPASRTFTRRFHQDPGQKPGKKCPRCSFPCEYWNCGLPPGF